MGKFIDLTGQRFGKLIVFSLDHVDKKLGAFWLCKCDCGNEKVIQASSLKNGGTSSCGCLRIPNLKGVKFGKLTVIEQSVKNKHGWNSWKCKCDCGNEKTVSARSLITGNTKSCGCLGNPFKKNYGESSYNNLFSKYKKSAENRGLVFNLSDMLFKRITKDKCFYCGCDPSQIQKNDYNNGDYIYNGIDRIDSSEGYTADNVVPCCGRCNTMKMAMGQQEFLDHIEKIHNYQKEKNYLIL